MSTPVSSVITCVGGEEYFREPKIFVKLTLLVSARQMILLTVLLRKLSTRIRFSRDEETPFEKTSDGRE